MPAELELLGLWDCQYAELNYVQINLKGAERQEWIQRLPVKPHMRAASTPQEQPRERGTEQGHGGRKSTAATASVGKTQGAARETIRPHHKKQTSNFGQVEAPKSNNKGQNESLTTVRTTERSRQGGTERGPHIDAIPTAEPSKSVVPEHLPDNRQDAPLKTRAEIVRERQAKVQDVQCGRGSFDQLKIWTKQWSVEDAAWKAAAASSQAAGQSFPSVVPAGVRAPSPEAPASVPVTGTQPAVTKAVSLSTMPKKTSVGSGNAASRWAEQLDGSEPGDAVPKVAKPGSCILASRWADQPDNPELEDANLMESAEMAQAMPSPSKSGRIRELAASAPETVKSTMRAQAAIFVPTFPNSQTQRTAWQPAKQTGPREQSLYFETQQALEDRERVVSDDAGELEQRDADRGPARKSSPLPKMKGAIKSRLISEEASSQSTALPNPAQTTRSISFDDLPSVLEVTAWDPNDRATESPDSDGPLSPEDEPVTDDPGEDDPELAALLQDPAVLQLVNRQLYETLQHNRDVMRTVLDEADEFRLNYKKLQYDLQKQSNLRAKLEASEKTWREDKEKVLTELKYLRKGKGRASDGVNPTADQLWQTLLKRDEEMKQLVQERELQGQRMIELATQLEAQQLREMALLTAGGAAENDREKATAELRQQRDVVQQLKTEIREQQAAMARLEERLVDATTGREQVSDLEIKAQVDAIYSGLWSFVTDDLRALKNEGNFNPAALPEHTQAWAKIYISTSTSPPPAYLHPFILISIICKTLCEAFKAHHYFGAPLTSPVQAAVSMAKALRPERSHDTRPWFDVVWKLIDQKDGEVLPRAEQSLLREMVEGVKADLGKSLAMYWWSTAMEQGLQAVFKRALDLFHVLHRQDARYFVDMAPAKGWTFAAAQMEEVSGQGEEVAALKGRDIEVSVFPVVYKRGGGQGEDEFVTTVLSKARVIVKAK